MTFVTFKFHPSYKNIRDFRQWDAEGTIVKFKQKNSKMKVDPFQ